MLANYYQLFDEHSGGKSKKSEQTLRVVLYKRFDPLHHLFWSIFLQKVTGILKLVSYCVQSPDVGEA